MSFTTVLGVHHGNHLVPDRRPGCRLAGGRAVKGGGYGLVGDMVVGILGALLGGYLFGSLGGAVGGGLLGSIVVATLGAVILIVILRVIKRA